MLGKKKGTYNESTRGKKTILKAKMQQGETEVRK